MNFNNENGYTLVTVLLVVLLLTILGGAYILSMNFEVRESYRHDHRVQTYYLARSGVEAASDWLINNQNEFLKVVEGEIVSKENTETILISGNFEKLKMNNSGGNPDDISVKIDFLNEEGTPINNESEKVGEIQIQGKGFFRGQEETVTLTLNPVGPFDNAVYSNAPIDATKREPTIIGDVQSSGSIEGDEDNITGEIKPNAPLDYELPDFPQCLPDEGNLQVSGDIEILGNASFDRIRITGGKTLTVRINEEDEDGELIGGTSCLCGNENDCSDHFDDPYVNQIMVNELTGLGTLDTICSCDISNDFCEECALILYITGDSELQTPSGGNQVPIFVFLADNVTLTLRAGSKFNGYIYGPTATVAMASVGPDQEEPDIYGAIIVDELQRNSEQADFDGLIMFAKHDNLLRKIDLSTLYNKLQRGIWK